MTSDPHARLSDPRTSQMAGARVRLNERCAEVLGAMYASGLVKFTDGDIAAFMREDRNIVARRRKDLFVRGMVQAHINPENGLQLVSDGRRGRDELVWRLTPEGEAYGREIATS